MIHSHNVSGVSGWRTGGALLLAVLWFGPDLFDERWSGPVAQGAEARKARQAAAKKAREAAAKKAEPAEADDWEDDEEEAPKKAAKRKAAKKSSRWTGEAADEASAASAPPGKGRPPKELWEEAIQLFEMGKYKEAASYFEVFAASKPSNESLLELQRRHGPAFLLRLSAKEPVRPAAERLIKLVSRAVSQSKEDPQRVAQAVELLSGDVHDRALGMARLQLIGVRALPALMLAVARSRDPALSGSAARAIRYMGFDAVPALVVVLDSRNAKMVQFALLALTALGDPSAVPWIRALQQNRKRLGPVRARAEVALEQITRKPAERLPSAKDMLLAEARRHYHRLYDPLEDRSTVRVWSWSDKTGLSIRDMPGEVAADWLAWDACRRAYGLVPTDPAVLALYVCVGLAQEELLPPDDPWHVSAQSARSLARVLPWRRLSACLTQAMADGKGRVVRRLCEILGQVGREEMLRAWSPHRCPLMQALAWPDRRVQMQAALAVVHLRPRQRFPGSADVLAVLQQGLRLQQKLRVLLIDADPSRPAEYRRRWEKLGWGADVAPSGPQARRMLTEGAPFDLVCVQGDTKRPGVIEALQMLRGHERARPLPIIVVVSLEQRRALTAKFRQIPRLWLLPSGTTPEQFAERVGPLVKRLGLTAWSAKQCDALATTVLDLLLALARDRACPFDVVTVQPSLLDILNHAAHGPRAAQLLGLIPTRAAQVALYEKTLGTTTPAKLRAAAMAGLAESLRCHGVQMSAQQRKQLTDHLLKLTDPVLRPQGLEIVSLVGPDAEVEQTAFKRFRPVASKPAGAASP